MFNRIHNFLNNKYNQLYDFNKKSINFLGKMTKKVSEQLFNVVFTTLVLGASGIYCFMLASPYILCGILLSKTFILANITLDKMIEASKK